MTKTDKIKTALLLALAVVSFGVIAAFLGYQYTMAAYAQSYVKGVAATGTISTQLISSNLLYSYKNSSDTAAANTLSFNPAEGEENVSITVTISNYVQNYMSMHNAYDVMYDLTITPQNLSSEEIDFSRGFAVKASTPTEETLTLGNGAWTKTNIRLTGLAAMTHSYTISFPKEYLNKISFLVQANLANGNNTGYAKLAASLVPVQKIQTSESLRGELLYNAQTSDDGYTYEITLNGADTNVQLTWPEGLEPDSYFYYTPAETTEYTDVNRYDQTKKRFATVDKDNRTAAFPMKSGTIVVNFYRTSAALNPDLTQFTVQKTETQDTTQSQ